tara:strand:- start:435 stop:1280 length:846 start_codon:yes stop_codon:yes gene_type:complete
MNKSKILAASGLATVMSATAATADSVSLNGYIEGWFTSGDKNSGLSNSVYSQSIYVSYSTTLDNGMGLGVGFTLTSSAHAAGFNIDTGMGTLATGTYWQVNSAADAMDSLPNNANVQSSNKVLGSYNDGDDASGEGIKYTSPSINGWTMAASIGENVSTDRVTSVAVKGSVMGVSVAAGAVDQVGSADDSFVTLGYSIAGVGIGYGMYDSDDDETVALSVTTDVAGMTVGYRYDDLDASTDNSQNTYSISKDMGGMSLTLMFEEQDTADKEEWNLVYAMGF